MESHETTIEFKSLLCIVSKCTRITIKMTPESLLQDLASGQSMNLQRVRIPSSLHNTAVAAKIDTFRVVDENDDFPIGMAF